MSKPRSSAEREIFGILGKHEDARTIQRDWNAYFAAREMDAFMDKYECSQENLPERLSEMYHFDRRAYIVSSSLQEAILPLLDALDSSAEGEGRVSVVRNDGGVLTGYFTEQFSPEDVL